MARNAFEVIRSMLNFNDNTLETSDKLQKLRPVIDRAFQANFCLFLDVIYR